TRYRYGTAKRLLDRAGQVLGDRVGRAPRAVRREWIEIEQARFVVAYFHRRRLEEASAILERLGPVVERDGTPSQRSLYYQCRANALVVVQNYRFSEAAVAYEERAIAALEGSSEARLELAHARFDLGFMLV